MLIILFASNRERKHQKEREENWRQLQQKVEKLNISNDKMDIVEVDGPEEYNTNSEYVLGIAEDELEDVDILDNSPADGTTAVAEQKDDIHPDMQQFDVQPTQYQFFRRKSIIPVDETVSDPK